MKGFKITAEIGEGGVLVDVDAGEETMSYGEYKELLLEVYATLSTMYKKQKQQLGLNTSFEVKGGL